MDNVEWHPFFYNGLETNIEVTRCGRVRRVPKDWIKLKYYKDVYEVDLAKRSLTKGGYMQLGVCIINFNMKTFLLHKIIASVFLNHNIHGRVFVIDHLDSNKINNHVDNLRVVTFRENCSKEKTIKSGLPAGVSYANHSKTKKYRSFFWIKTLRHIGYYSNVEEASRAYQDAVKALNKFLEDTHDKGDTDEWFSSYRAKMKSKPSNIGEQLPIQFN